MHRIVVWLPDEDLRVLDFRSADFGFVDVVRCREPEELKSATDTHRVDCFVVDAIASSHWFEDKNWLALLGSAPVVIRADLTPRGAQAVHRISKPLTGGCVSIRGVDDLSEDITRAIHASGVPSVELRLLNPIRVEIGRPALAVVVAIAVLGRRRVGVKELALRCAIPRRTLEWRLRRSCRQTPTSLIGWSLALHTAWRVDALNWPLKRCASMAGFKDTRELSSYVERHVGARPRQLCVNGGFDALFERWREHFDVVK